MRRRLPSAFRAVTLGLSATLVVAAAGIGCRAAAPTPLVSSPEEIARGERVFRRWCLHCHSDIPLAPRVRGWTPEGAYAAVGRLPEITPAMPPFRGSDDERRALAVYVASLGSTR